MYVSKKSEEKKNNKKKKQKNKESGCGILKHSHFDLCQGQVITNAQLWAAQR